VFAGLYWFDLNFIGKRDGNNANELKKIRCELEYDYKVGTIE